MIRPNSMPDILSKYDTNAPRYTSYPTVLQLHNGFTSADFLSAINRSNEAGKLLSLYFHLPFCKNLCYYCACNKTVSASQEISKNYLQSILAEMELLADLFNKNRSVIQLHWGGGTPTFLTDSEMTELMFYTGKHFSLLSKIEGDYSIELDPRDLNQERIALIGGLGFNRVSLGIQDFDERVQLAINRIQPYAEVTQVVRYLRDYDFSSINMDLIYGLPYQNTKSFENTVAKVIHLQPDRLSIFNYAHLPQRFKSQKLIKEETLPSTAEKLAMFVGATRQLIDAGYIYIGMDHFAKKDDKLAIAQETGDLHRNFQGYTSHKNSDLIGFGVSSISQIDNTISQNFKTNSEYQNRANAGKLCMERGLSLNEDDEIRRWTIMQLICHYQVNFDEFSNLYHKVFQEHFFREFIQLEELAKDKLLSIDEYGIRTINNGNQVIRYMCMIFDRYNGESMGSTKQFSRIM